MDDLRAAVEWVLNDAAYKAPEQVGPEARRWIARLREAVRGEPAHERIPPWWEWDAAGAIAALAELLGLEPPLPSPDEIVAVAVDGLLLLREAYEADQAEDLDRLRLAFAKAGRLLGKMKLPPAEGGPE